MLSDLFYFIGFFLFLGGMGRLFNNNKLVEITDWLRKFKKVTKKTPTPKEFRSESEWVLTVTFGTLSLFDSIWILIGFLSSNWLIFLSLSLLTIVQVNSIRVLNIALSKIANFIFVFVKVLTFGLLVLNHFHLHLNLNNFIPLYIFNFWNI